MFWMVTTNQGSLINPRIFVSNLIIWLCLQNGFQDFMVNPIVLQKNPLEFHGPAAFSH